MTECEREDERDKSAMSPRFLGWRMVCYSTVTVTVTVGEGASCRGRDYIHYWMGAL